PTFAGAVLALRIVYRNIATGQPEASTSRGTSGLKASRRTCTGNWGSAKAMRANGYAPVKVASARRGRPGALFEPRPLEFISYGGWRRDSNTRATGPSSPTLAQMAGKA